MIPKNIVIYIINTSICIEGESLPRIMGLKKTMLRVIAVRIEKMRVRSVELHLFFSISKNILTILQFIFNHPLYGSHVYTYYFSFIVSKYSEQTFKIINFNSYLPPINLSSYSIFC